MNRFGQGDGPVERRIGLAQPVDDFDFVAGEQATLLQSLETGGGFGAVTQFHFDYLLFGFQKNEFAFQKIKKRSERGGGSKRRPRVSAFMTLPSLIGSGKNYGGSSNFGLGGFAGRRGVDKEMERDC